MTKKKYIDNLIHLSNKKIEALSYLKKILDEMEESAPCQVDINDYYQQKYKVEQALLKVDLEFLEVYNTLLETEQANRLSEISAFDEDAVKLLQKLIQKVQILEKEIVSIEVYAFGQKQSPSSGKGPQVRKHLAPRADKAYKKFKK